MCYQTSDARWVDTLDLTLAASAARTETDDGDAAELGTKRTIIADLDVTAGSGTDETLDVVLQTSEDGSTWRTLGAFAQKTGVAAERKSFPGADRQVRASWTIGGTATPSFTFSVTAECV